MIIQYQRARYVITILKKYIDNPTAEKFQPGNIHKLEGSTAPTLIGGLEYVRKFLPSAVMMENVEGVKPTLELIKTILEDMAYEFYASPILDPPKFYLPNHRRRIYFGGVRNRRSTSFDVNGEFNDCIKRVSTACSRSEGAAWPLSLFLLDLDSPYLRNLSEMRVNAADDLEGLRWPDKHEEAFQKIGRSGRPSAAELEEFAGEMHPTQRAWFPSLSLKCQDMLIQFVSLSIL